MDVAQSNFLYRRWTILHLLFFALMILALSPRIIYAQKITKVKGSQVIFSVKGLSVSGGDILVISSDGYEAGKLKVVKVGSSAAIGKIIEGSALIGDKVKIDKKSSPSLDSGDSYLSSNESSKGSRASNKKSGRSKFYGAVGLGMLNFSTIETATGDFEFNAMTGINLKVAKMNSRGGWGASFYFGRTTAAFKQRSALIFNDIDFNYLRLNFDLMKALFTKGIYGRLGAGIASGSITATIQGYGNYTLDLTGVNGNAGLGYQYLSNNWFVQLEGEIGIAYYMSSKATAPAGLTAASPGVIGQMVYGAIINVGHSF
ncbi:MAG: hypothetical protein QE271_06565 [Bacteriovoracaceae bacterium]|nr:hypothetical protein [Bacteriovoracaceae bacterium]